MIIVRKKTTNNQFFLREGKGFFGRLWGRIKKNIGTIVGFIAGGPVGSAIGALVQSLLSENPKIDVSYGKASRDLQLNIDVINEDAYPITEAEESLLMSWLNNKFKPTIVSISNNVDQNIQINFSKIATSTKEVILVLNKALKDISVLKAYALHIEQFGEYQTGYFSTTKFSDNYVINKVEAMFIVLDQVEKGILKYMVDNGFTDYKLTAQAQNISSINQVGQVAIDWQGQNVEANIKQYKEASQVNNTEVIDVTNIDLTNTDPATSTDTEVINAEGEAKPTNNKLLKVAGVTTAIVLIRKALKNKKKTK